MVNRNDACRLFVDSYFPDMSPEEAVQRIAAAVGVGAATMGRDTLDQYLSPRSLTDEEWEAIRESGALDGYGEFVLDHPSEPERAFFKTVLEEAGVRRELMGALSGS